jgi:hypothetical protein
MAQLIDLGKLRFEFRGDYDPSEEYESNDVVRYGGNLYAYINVTAATGVVPTNTSNWSLMLEGFNFRGTWSGSEQYYIGDIVAYGGKIYIADVDSLNKIPGTDPEWDQLVDGIQYEGVYDNTTEYQTGDVVTYGGATYIATQDTVGNAPSNVVYWDMLVNGVSYRGAYDAVTEYLKNDIVAYGSGAYVATQDTVGNAPSDTIYWDMLVNGVRYLGLYDETTEYLKNDIVTYGGGAYIAKEDSVGSDPSNTSNWDIFVEGIQYEGDYDNSTNYQLGDVVNYGGVVYICIQDTIGNIPTNTTYWSVLIEGIAYKGAYSSETEYNKNDIVSYDGSAWIALQNTTGNDPETGENWDILASGTFPSFVGNENYVLSNDGTEALWTDEISITKATLSDHLYVGTGSEEFEVNAELTNNVASFRFDTGSEDEEFAQISFQNADPTSSTDFIAYPNNGHDEYGWLSVGVTGSDFADPLFPLTGNNDAYIFFDAPKSSSYSITNKELLSNVATLVLDSTPESYEVYPGVIVDISDVGEPFDGRYTVSSVDLENDSFSYNLTAANVSSVSATGTADFNNVDQGGNLVIATGDSGTDNKIVFAAGGFSSGNTQMEITPDVNVHVEIPTPSTSPQTGALTVVGGVGIQGDMNIQGDVNIVGTIAFGGEGTVVETQNLAVSDPTIYVGSNNLADNFDLGMIAEYAEDVADQIASVDSKSLTGNVAELQTTVPHGYSIGDVVVVTGVDETFNGTYVITDVPTSTTFRYPKTAGNVSTTAVSPLGTATVTHERRWGGIVRDASDSGIVKVFSGSTEKPTTAVNFANSGLVYPGFKAGAGDFSSLSTPNITTSGGTLNLGGTVNVSSAANFTGATVNLGSSATATTPAVNTNSTAVATTAYVVGQAGTGNPLVNGTVAVGTSLLYSRQDHVHPTDTTRAPLASPTFTGLVTMPTGTTTVAPLRLVSGSVKTTPAVGEIEYDGKTAYFVHTGSLRAALVASNYFSLSANRSLANATGVQSIFGVGLNVAAATTYEIQYVANINTTGATSNQLGISFGGTATLTSIGYRLEMNQPATQVAGASVTQWVAAATNVYPLGAIATASFRTVYVRGIVRVNAAGTFIPQCQFSAAPGAAPIVALNSYIKMTPIGLNTVTTVGSWA